MSLLSLESSRTRGPRVRLGQACCGNLGSAGGAVGRQAHQDVEADLLTVLLAGGEQGSPVGVAVSAFIQVGPWRVPPLIHGGVVPDAWRNQRVRLRRWSHVSPQDCLLFFFLNSLCKVSLLQEALQAG